MNEYIELLMRNDISFLTSKENDSICFTLNGEDYEILNGSMLVSSHGKCKIFSSEDVAILLALC